MPYSSLSREERFWARVAILMIAIAILTAAGLAWFLFQAKVQNEAPDDSPAATANSPNGPDPAAMLFNSATNTSTNALMSLPPPALSVTN